MLGNFARFTMETLKKHRILVDKANMWFSLKGAYLLSRGKHIHYQADWDVSLSHGRIYQSLEVRD